MLQSVAPYEDGERDELILMILDEASIAGSIGATFTHHDDGTAPPFEVSTPLETGQCLV